MSSSIQAGVKAADRMRAHGAVVMTCDQPAVSAGHLRQLTEAGGEERIIASSYADRKGVPAYFPASFFAALQALQGDSGARDLLLQAMTIDLPYGELDVDTEEKLELAQRLLQRTLP